MVQQHHTISPWQSQHRQKSAHRSIAEEALIPNNAATTMAPILHVAASVDHHHDLEEKKVEYYPPTTCSSSPQQSRSMRSSCPAGGGGTRREMMENAADATHYVHFSSPQNHRGPPSHSNYSTPQGDAKSSWTTHRHNSHINASIAPSLSLERTKSWTDHARAPEPFSSPAPAKSKLRPFNSNTNTNSNNNQRSISSTNNTPQKKHGYGNLFRSASSGVATRNNSMTLSPRRSLHGGRHPAPGPVQHGNVSSHGRQQGRGIQRGKSMGSGNGSSYGRQQGYPIQRGNSMGGGAGRIMALTPIIRQPSFAKSDFPSLSPAKSPAKPKALRQDSSSSVCREGRQASWSAVASTPVTSCDNDSTACPSNTDTEMFAGIPPMPLVDGNTLVEAGGRSAEETSILVDKEVDSCEEVILVGDDNAADPPSRTDWQDRRQRAHSFHHYSSSDHDRIKLLPSQQSHTPQEFHPFSTFTTTSIAALQNDIGTLLARSNRVDEALERYKSSIAAAEGALLGLEMERETDGGSSSGSSSTTDDDEDDEENDATLPRKKCPKVTEAEGLAWFRQKLLRGDMEPAAPIPTTSTDAPDVGTKDGVASSLPPLPTFFQPAGFGGLVAPKSPGQRRMRSASFSVQDMRPPVLPRHLAMPCIRDRSHIVTSASADGAPMSPIRPRSKPPAMAACPVTAPHPGKPTLVTKQFSRTSSTGSALERSSSFHRHTHASGSHPIAPRNDIVHAIHQHQKLDCPDEVYSCNGLTPLGMEYVCDPLPVLGYPLRSLLSEIGGGSAKSSRRKRVETELMEMASLISSRLNLASLEYRLAGGGVGDKLQEVLETLELALEDCRDATKAIENLTGGEGDCDNRTKSKVVTLFCLLRAVVHSNLGTVQYRLKKVRDSMASFEAAQAALENESHCGDGHYSFYHDRGPGGNFGNPHVETEPHDDNRFPPQNYLLLVVRLNSSRVLQRMNKNEEASKLCRMIFEDNKPHRRNSSRRSLQGSAYPGFRRSNSFSAASSALTTAIAAYEHDIDRRSKWLGSVSEHYLTGLICESKGESTDYKEALHHYNGLLSTARVKLDHRHPYICALLERRGAVLFEQRKLQCSILSYLACFKILEHQQSTGSTVFNKADLSRVLYAVARVLHDKEEYHDALAMYQRALACQRALAAVSGRPSLEVITTLCNISRVHHLSGEIDEALATNQEVLDLATMLVGGKLDHPFVIHRLKVEGNILVEAGRLEDAMRTFVEAARRCSEDGRDRMMNAMMGDGRGGSNGANGGSSQEDADAGDSSVLSIRSAAALAQINFIHPSAAAA